MRKLLLLAGVVLFSGCVTMQTAEQRQQDQMEYLVRTTETAIKEKDYERLGNAIQPTIQRGGAARIAELFKKYPQGAELYRGYFERSIEGMTIPEQPESLRRHLTEVRPTRLIDEQTVADLSAKLSAAVVQANSRGTVPFRLAHLQTFPELAPSKAILADRSIAAANDQGKRMESFQSLAAYLKELGPESSEAARVQAKIVAIGLKRGDADYFQQIPAMAKLIQDSLFAPAHFQFKGGDRLSSDDMKQALQAKFKGLVFVDQPSDGAIVVTVERVRYDEQRGSERRETVTYAQHQVNLLSAALLMPRNASYIYDVVALDSAIDYGYVVTVEGKGSRFEEVARGKIESREVRCSNARIQNVFGGVTAADFIANDHMNSTCRSGNNKTIDTLRREVYESVVATAAKAPQLKGLSDD